MANHLIPPVKPVKRSLYPISISPEKNLINPKEEMTMEKTIKEEDGAELDTESAELKAKLKKCELAVYKYVLALEAENLGLVEKLAKCEAQKVTLRNRITLQKKELAERPEKAESLSERLKRLKGKVVPDGINIPPECIEDE
jgi:chromosome segregation ATPase